MNKPIYCLFLLVLIFSHVLFAQTHKNNPQIMDNVSLFTFDCYHHYTLDKEPLSFWESWRIKKDGIPVGKIEKEPIALWETYQIKDSMGMKIGTVEKDFISFGNGYTIKDSYGMRIGRMEKVFDGWQIWLDPGKKLEFNEDFTEGQCGMREDKIKGNIKPKPFDFSYKVKLFGEDNKGESLLKGQLPMVGPKPMLNNQQERKRKNLLDETNSGLLGSSNYLNPPLMRTQTQWRLPSVDDMIKDMTRIPDPMEDMNTSVYGFKNMYVPSWKRDREHNNNQWNSFGNMRNLGGINLFDDE